MVEVVDKEENMDKVEIHGSGVPTILATGTPSRSVSNTTNTGYVF